MKLVYIAGPYTAKHVYLVKRNIRQADMAGEEVIIQGRGKLFPVIPHKNTEFMEGLREGDYFIEGTKELMRKCHVILVVPGSDWGDSVGTIGEIIEAETLGITVTYSITELLDWLHLQDLEEGT